MALKNSGNWLVNNMELKEAIRILNWSQQQMRLGNLPGYSQNVNQAIKTVLQALEELQEENKKLKTKNRTQKKLTEFVREATTEQVVSTIEEFEKEYISKDKIKEKIEEIKTKSSQADGSYFMNDYKIEALEELLKGE